jgi:hypothetical protein
VGALLAIGSRGWYAFLMPEEKEWKEICCSMAKPTLLPDPACLHLKLLDASETVITVVVTILTHDIRYVLLH